MMAAACKKDTPPAAPPPPEVAVVRVEPRRVPTAFDFTGEVQPYRRVEVRARVDGVIEARPFTEGSVVKPGQVLYRIDPVRPEAAYRSALARDQTAKRAVARYEPLLGLRLRGQQRLVPCQGPLGVLISSQGAPIGRLRSALARYQNAKRTLARYEPLLAQK